MGSIKWTVFNKLPKRGQDYAIRKNFKVPTELPKDWVFKVLSEEDEYLQAFQLVYDSYNRAGIIDNSGEKIKYIEQHLLPHTVVLVVKRNGMVIATMTIVPDSPLGLPSEKNVDISNLRQKGANLAEISALAIKDEFRNQKGKILLSLTKFMYEVCTYHLKIDTIVCTTHPKFALFYRSLLLFSDLGEIFYTKITGLLRVPGQAMYLHINRLPFDYKNVYGRQRDDRNLFKFYCKARFRNFYFNIPEYSCGLVNQIPLTKLMPELIKDKSSTQILLSYLNKAKSFDELRDAPRFVTTLSGSIVQKSKDIPILIKSSSIHGVGGLIKGNLPKRETLVLLIKISDEDVARLKVKFQHKANNNYCGIKILEATPNWFEYINMVKVGSRFEDWSVEIAKAS